MDGDFGETGCIHAAEKLGTGGITLLHWRVFAATAAIDVDVNAVNGHEPLVVVGVTREEHLHAIALGHGQKQVLHNLPIVVGGAEMRVVRIEIVKAVVP